MTDNWRNWLQVHPAADIFPMMSEAELRELGEDIREHGLKQPLTFYGGEEDEIEFMELFDRLYAGKLPLLDGRNRLSAMELVGILDKEELLYLLSDESHAVDDPFIGTQQEAQAFVISANIRRRHLNAEQKRSLIEQLIKANPERSDRAVAKLAQASPTTVGTIRQDLEREGTVSKLDTRVGADGVVQPARKPRPDPAAQRGQPHRDGPDFWPTPLCLTEALVRYVIPDLPPAPIWECAAGSGLLAQAIRSTGRQVIATDLYPHIDSEPHDFLTDEPPAATCGAIAITNPPFAYLDEFLARGLALLDSGALGGFVVLLRHDHLMAGSRVPILNRMTRVIHCNWRPTWIADSEGNGRWAFCWAVWDRGSRHPPKYVEFSDELLSLDIPLLGASALAAYAEATE